MILSLKLIWLYNSSKNVFANLRIKFLNSKLKMNMFCCHDTTINRKNYRSVVFNEFTYTDPITKQISK